MQISIHMVCFHHPAFNYKTGRAINTSSECLNNFQCQLKVTSVLSIVTKQLSKSFEDCQSSLRIVWMGWQRPEREVFARKKMLEISDFCPTSQLTSCICKYTLKAKKPSHFWDLPCRRMLVSIHVTSNRHWQRVCFELQISLCDLDGNSVLLLYLDNMLIRFELSSKFRKWANWHL